MKKLFSIFLITLPVYCQGQTTEIEIIQQRIGETLLLPAPTDSVDIQKIIDEAKNLRLEINDINSRMEDYANLNNGAFLLTLVGTGLVIWGELDNEEVLTYVGAGLVLGGTFMLYLNSNKLKKKWDVSPGIPSHVARRLKRQ